jgi:hypothetical protein
MTTRRAALPRALAALLAAAALPVAAAPLVAAAGQPIAAAPLAIAAQLVAAAPLVAATGPLMAAARPAAFAPPADPASAGGAERVPPPGPGSTAIMCQADEPGPRLLIAGQVLDGSGHPVAGAQVVAYNADAQGLYNPRNSPTRVPRIRGAVTSDTDGKFQLLTVSPGPYPDASEPAHVHFEVNCPGYRLRYSTIWFAGDPLITLQRQERARRWTADHPQDVTRVETPGRIADGLTLVRHTIVLEEN